MTIRTVAWAVQPGATALTRPRRLVAELEKLGAVDHDASYIFHGRTAERPGQKRSSALPGLSLSSSRDTAVLSPLFLAGHRRPAKWVDLYDDWSLAPDLRPHSRVLAGLGYRQLGGRAAGDTGLVTVNSRYMARKLSSVSPLLVPNGVDRDLAVVKTTGDAKRRLIVLGHFFSGRTDYDLLRRVALLPAIQEVLIGGPGKDPRMVTLMRDLRARRGDSLVVREWLDADALGKAIGEQTVALIPNKVSDYTLSQDLMKAYTFQALGVPTLCPSMLWPEKLDSEHAYLTGHGDRLEDHFAQWLAAARPDQAWRDNFVNQNSWRSRAAIIAEKLS